MDLDITPEEHALRDLFPGWTPCRALTEDEMIRPESPYAMEIGSYPRSAPPKLIIPVVPTDWTDNWPEPAPLAATGVSRGWWWMPEDPKWFGAWVVLGQGKAGRGHHFFTLVTTPLRAVDYGRFERGRSGHLFGLAAKLETCPRKWAWSQTVIATTVEKTSAGVCQSSVVVALAPLDGNQPALLTLWKPSMDRRLHPWIAMIVIFVSFRTHPVRATRRL